MKFALIQNDLVWNDVDENLSSFDSFVSEIMRVGSKPDVIVLPEMFVSGFAMDKLEKIAERYDDVKSQMCKWAKQTGAMIIASTVYREMCFSEYAKENAYNYYNRCLAIWVENDAFVIKYYDKHHCFTMGEENKFFTAGDDHCIFEYKGWRFSLFVCYDLRFPVWCRNTQNYDVAVYVASWPESRRNVWQTLLQARAIENQAYVVGVNRVGVDGMNNKYSGNSIVVDYFGNIVNSLHDGQISVMYADLDIDKLSTFRMKFPVLRDMDEFKILLD